MGTGALGHPHHGAREHAEPSAGCWGRSPASSESSAKPQSSSPSQTRARGMQRPLAQRNSGGAQAGGGQPRSSEPSAQSGTPSQRAPQGTHCPPAQRCWWGAQRGAQTSSEPSPQSSSLSQSQAPGTQRPLVRQGNSESGQRGWGGQGWAVGAHCHSPAAHVLWGGRGSVLVRGAPVPAPYPVPRWHQGWGHPTRTPLTSSCSPAAPRHRAGRRCPPRHMGTRWGRCSCPLPPDREVLVSTAWAIPTTAPQQPHTHRAAPSPRGRSSPPGTTWCRSARAAPGRSFGRSGGRGGRRRCTPAPRHTAGLRRQGGHGAVSCQPWGEQDPQPGPPNPSLAPETGTHGTGPGSSIGCGRRAGRTPRRRWRWPCTGTRSPPQSHSCRKGTAGWCCGGDRHRGARDPLPGGVCGPAPTRRHRRHTSRRSAGTAPPRGRAQRAAA